jgi:hypothetical protein
MVTVYVEYTNRELADANREELAAWFAKRKVETKPCLLGLCFTVSDVNAVNLTEELLFSRKFKGISATIRDLNVGRK